MPLVVRVDSADIMATLLRLKSEVEHVKKSSIRMVFSEASEAHLLADDIGNSPAVPLCSLRANLADV